jgi:hypothetical protein
MQRCPETPANGVPRHHIELPWGIEPQTSHYERVQCSTVANGSFGAGLCPTVRGWLWPVTEGAGVREEHAAFRFLSRAAACYCSRSFGVLQCLGGVSSKPPRTLYSGSGLRGHGVGIFR